MRSIVESSWNSLLIAVTDPKRSFQVGHYQAALPASYDLCHAVPAPYARHKCEAYAMPRACRVV